MISCLTLPFSFIHHRKYCWHTLRSFTVATHLVICVSNRVLTPNLSVFSDGIQNCFVAFKFQNECEAKEMGLRIRRRLGKLKEAAAPHRAPEPPRRPEATHLALAGSIPTGSITRTSAFSFFLFPFVGTF